MRRELAALALVGCASSATAPSYVGSWITPGGYVAGATTLEIDADGGYAMADIYAVDGGALAEVERGAVSVDDAGTGLRFVPAEDSCHGLKLPPYTDGFRAAAGSLAITPPFYGGTTEFVPNAAPDAVTTGCFVTGSFIPSPVVSLDAGP